MGRPASAEAGLRAIREARGKLLAFGSLTDVIVVKGDASSIRLKATWQEARFTLSFTANTGYIDVQGSSGLLLAFGSHVASVIGVPPTLPRMLGHRQRTQEWLPSPGPSPRTQHQWCRQRTQEWLPSPRTAHQSPQRRAQCSAQELGLWSPARLRGALLLVRGCHHHHHRCHNE